MKELNSVIFKSLQTVIVKFSGRLSGLFLSIFLARMLGAEDLGIISFINQFLAIILVISMLGIRMVLVKKYLFIILMVRIKKYLTLLRFLI